MLTGVFASVALSLPLRAFAQEAADQLNAITHAALPDAPSAVQSDTQNAFVATLGSAAKTIAKDEARIVSAPFQKKALVWDVIAVGATGALIATDERVAQQVPSSWHQTGLHLSDACTYGTAAAAGGILLAGLATHNEHAQQTGILSAEAAVDTVLLTGAMKFAFSRERPYTNNSEGNFLARNFSSGSFPSGHSALAWSMATVVAKEYPRTPVRLAMYGLATTVSLTRVTAGEHFPSDVVVGSAVGYLVGTFVTNKNKGPESRKPGLKGMSHYLLEHVAFQ